MACHVHFPDYGRRRMDYLNTFTDLNKRFLPTWFKSFLFVILLISSAFSQNTLVYQEIGAPGKAGSSTYDNLTNTINLKSSGKDIWGTSDQFGFLFQPMTGNGVVTVKLKSVSNTNAWTKTGIMFRDSLAADSKNIFLFGTPTGIYNQKRLETTAITTNTFISLNGSEGTVFDHSAQFESNNMKRNPFYAKILEQFDLNKK